jgi:hypothetical protein
VVWTDFENNNNNNNNKVVWIEALIDATYSFSFYKSTSSKCPISSFIP